MTARTLLLRSVFRYGFAVGLREWDGCSRIDPKVRTGVAAAAGAVVAPFVVFVAPAARLYWLITGDHLPGPLGWPSDPYVYLAPFSGSHPPEVDELLKRPEYRWEPGPGDIPLWLDLWARLAALVRWQRPVGLRGPAPEPASARHRSQPAHPRQT